MFVNYSADGNFEVTLTTKATIYSKGLVEWKPPAIYSADFVPLYICFGSTEFRNYILHWISCKITFLLSKHSNFQLKDKLAI